MPNSDWRFEDRWKIVQRLPARRDLEGPVSGMASRTSGKLRQAADLALGFYDEFQQFGGGLVAHADRRKAAIEQESSGK